MLNTACVVCSCAPPSWNLLRPRVSGPGWSRGDIFRPKPENLLTVSHSETCCILRKLFLLSKCPASFRVSVLHSLFPFPREPLGTGDGGGGGREGEREGRGRGGGRKRPLVMRWRSEKVCLALPFCPELR